MLNLCNSSMAFAYERTNRVTMLSKEITNAKYTENNQIKRRYSF